MKTIVISLAAAAAILLMLPAQGDEESLRFEIGALRQQLVAAENRIAKLETLTSLLMAAYQQEVKTRAEAAAPAVAPEANVHP